MQEHVAMLNHIMARQTERIAELSNSFLDSEGRGLQKTLVKMNGDTLTDPDVPLPDQAEIEFTITKHNRITVGIRASEFVPNKRVLKIMGNGCDPLLIKMHASNSLEIVFDEERKL